MKISFVIPFHNEEKNCRPMIERVVAYANQNKINYEIIAVDDRSDDQTGRIIRQLTMENKKIRSVFRTKDKEEKGNTMGKALIIGSRKATGDFIIWTMGDLSDQIETYGKIIDKLKDGFDLVFASRYMPGGSRGNLEPVKAFLSSWGTLLARVIFGVPVHDITNAFRGFRKKILANIQLESAGFSISPELAIKAHLAGFRLGEVPTVYTNRIEGNSSFKLVKMTRSYLKLYFSIFFRRLVQPHLFQ